MHKLFVMALAGLSTPALADTLVCGVTKVGISDSRQEVACGEFRFQLPHDTETKSGRGNCRGLELNAYWFGEGKVQLTVTPSKRELGPRGNDGYAWVGFHQGFPESFSLQAIGSRANHVIRCSVRK